MDSPFYFFLLFPLVLGDTPRRKYIATIFDFALFLFLGRLGIFYDLHAVRSCFFLFWRSRVIAVILQSTTVGAIHIATSTAVRSLPIAKGLGGPEGLTHHTTRRTDMCVCRVDTHTRIVINEIVMSFFSIFDLHRFVRSLKLPPKFPSWKFDDCQVEKQTRVESRNGGPAVRLADGQRFFWILDSFLELNEVA
jgi:hypothetical protein